MATAMEQQITIRDITDVAEMQLVEALEKEVWGVTDLDVVPVTQLVAVKHTGGVLIGAFDNRRLIGFAYGFVGYEKQVVTIHSHMLAVQSAYRNSDLGYRLKQAQRERALAQGIKRMTWTFDPLQSLNAYFNFHKLGVLSDSYRVDFYGDASTSFLHRNSTDRLWVTWLLDSRRVQERANSHGHKPDFEIQSESVLVRVEEDLSPQQNHQPEAFSGTRAFIEIPGNIRQLEEQNFELAIRWREATRWAFTSALASGFLVEDFLRSSPNGQRMGTYVLTRERAVADFE